MLLKRAIDAEVDSADAVSRPGTSAGSRMRERREIRGAESLQEQNAAGHGAAKAPQQDEAGRHWASWQALAGCWESSTTVSRSAGDGRWTTPRRTNRRRRLQHVPACRTLQRPALKPRRSGAKHRSLRLQPQFRSKRTFNNRD